MTTHENKHECKRVLIVGACALDRLLYVQKYPKEDAKIRCQASFEFGGGNAANTASGLGKLSRTKVLNTLSTNKIKVIVQLLTKVADDEVRKKISNELIDFSVDLSSELFLDGPKGSKSPVSTVVVSNDDSHSRTCIFDPGTCGVLESSDIEKVDMNVLFRDVLLLHSDSRHTDAAFLLAKEARNRSIPVSLDIERDRLISSFDNLIDLATIIFTSGDQLKTIITRRRTAAMNDNFEDEPEFDDPFSSFVHSKDTVLIDAVSTLYNLMNLRNDFGSNSIALIVTRGHLGAIHLKVRNYSSAMRVGSQAEQSYNKIKTKGVNKNFGKIALEQATQKVVTAQPFTLKVEKIEYEIHCIGPPHVDDIVDSTGAGDAFAAGYLWGEILLSQPGGVQEPDFDECVFKLRMGSWCAGKKLAGPGARATLPSSEEIRNELGMEIYTIYKSLENQVAMSSFL